MTTEYQLDTVLLTGHRTFRVAVTILDDWSLQN